MNKDNVLNFNEKKKELEQKKREQEQAKEDWACECCGACFGDPDLMQDCCEENCCEEECGECEDDCGCDGFGECVFDEEFDVVLFSKKYADVKIPSKREEDGAYDIYAWLPSHIDEVWIGVGEVVEMKTGLRSAFSPSLRFVLQERGSTGKIGLGINAGLIDSGYRGLWVVLLANDSNKNICISKKYDTVTVTQNAIFYPYSKAICQAKLETVPRALIIEIPEDELMKIPSERNEGRYGSSGK
jgi:dUTP pyrophosphatase